MTLDNFYAFEKGTPYRLKPGLRAKRNGPNTGLENLPEPALGSYDFFCA